MKLGLQINAFTWPGGSPEIGRRLGEIARATLANDLRASGAYAPDLCYAATAGQFRSYAITPRVDGTPCSSG